MVGQFDEYDVQIVCYGYQYFVEIFGLCFLVGSEFYFVQFGEIVNQFGDFFVEFFGQFVFGCVGIFENIVQQCCCYGVGIYLLFDYGIGYGQWVCDVRFV